MILHHKAKRIDNGEEIQGFLTKMWGQYHIMKDNDENTAYPIDEDTIEPCYAELEQGLVWINDVIFSENLTPEESRAAMEKQTETLTVDKAKTIAAKAICIGCGYLADCKCDYKGGNCMVSKPMLESVLKSFDDWNRRANDEKTD